LALLAIVLLLVCGFKIWNHHSLYLCAKTTQGIDFDPMRKHDTQTNGRYPSAADIESDLALLENKVRSVRTYSVMRGLDQVPALAEKHHLTVMLGAWLGVDLTRNRQELDVLKKTLQTQPTPNASNIIGVLVGNEALMRQDLSEQQLIDYIHEVRQFATQPISTSEQFKDWMAHPKLVTEVDYIAVHLTPYWFDVTVDEGVALVFDQYAQLQKAYPNKPIVITEVGWPSDGAPVGKSIASPENQTKFLCQFMRRAEKEKINYYILEAFDQPWKVFLEGSAGAHWGVFDADRNVKYPIHL
ncbi:MAG: glycosyl hydrolase family 17 protein, partial [Pseudomonadota bacterium]